MLIGGNPEPAYHITIAALPSQTGPTMNKRSVRLIQDFLCEVLEISPKRGVVKFEAIAEANLGTNGMTVLREIDELKRYSTEEESVPRNVSRQMSWRSKRLGAQSEASREKTCTPIPQSVTPHRSAKTTGIKEPKLKDESNQVRKRVKRRKSILAFFRR